MPFVIVTAAVDFVTVYRYCEFEFCRSGVWLLLLDGTGVTLHLCVILFVDVDYILITFDSIWWFDMVELYGGACVPNRVSIWPAFCLLNYYFTDAIYYHDYSLITVTVSVHCCSRSLIFIECALLVILIFVALPLFIAGTVVVAGAGRDAVERDLIYFGTVVLLRCSPDLVCPLFATGWFRSNVIVITYVPGAWCRLIPGWIFLVHAHLRLRCCICIVPGILIPDIYLFPVFHFWWTGVPLHLFITLLSTVVVDGYRCGDDYRPTTVYRCWADPLPLLGWLFDDYHLLIAYDLPFLRWLRIYLCYYRYCPLLLLSVYLLLFITQ